MDLSLDWKMTISFFAAMTVLTIPVKLTSIAIRGLDSLQDRRGYLLIAPTCVSTWTRARVITRRLPHGKELAELLLMFGLVIGEYRVMWPIVLSWTQRPLLLGYAALPIVLALVRTADLFFQIVFALMGRSLPPMHEHPLRSSSLADFWGKRWNRWINDWFRELASLMPQVPPALKVIIIFTLSGVLHELVINLPLSIWSGTQLFGTMMAFFFVSGIGTIVDRKLPRGARTARRIFFWLVLLVSVPLFMNEATLRIMHLWPQT